MPPGDDDGKQNIDKLSIVLVFKPAFHWLAASKLVRSHTNSRIVIASEFKELGFGDLNSVPN
jgi:hypothetical protein